MGNINEGGASLAYINTLTGGAFANATLFAMGHAVHQRIHYYAADLVAIPPLERMAKEGEEGRKKSAPLPAMSTVI